MFLLGRGRENCPNYCLAQKKVVKGDLHLSEYPSSRMCLHHFEYTNLIKTLQKKKFTKEKKRYFDDDLSQDFQFHN